MLHAVLVGVCSSFGSSFLFVRALFWFIVCVIDWLDCIGFFVCLIFLGVGHYSFLYFLC